MSAQQQSFPDVDLVVERWRRPRSRHAVALLTAVFVSAGFTVARAAERPRVIRGGERSAPVTPFVVNIDVRDLPEPEPWKPGDPVKEIPIRFYYPPGEAPLAAEQPGIDPLVQGRREASTAGTREADSFIVPSRNFVGQGYTGVNPPDTVGDVGAAHYIQAINSGGGARIRIYDKAEPTPNTLASFALDSLGSGACSSGYGDPIVLYDRPADRWLLSEFASSGNHLCVYISQTGDPVSGGWYFYDFVTPSFPDYPKYAVWPTDANEGDGSYIVTANDGGPGIYALDRGPMLTGDPSSFQRFSIPRLSGVGVQGPAPADPDGADPPPTGASAIIMRHRDTESHGGPAAPGDLLEMWLFDVDWDNASNTVLTQATSVDVAEFDSTLCGLSSSSCFPQPTGTSLMPLREVIMNRLQYINHGDFETLVGNFVVDVDGTNHGGVRWFELRRSGGAGWSVHQEGTYSIDSDHRWMGSSAMDQAQNIALAYNIVSTSQYPSLRYTGRKAEDTPGVMTEPESVIHAGTASNSSFRYGDYAAMGLDPEDDCTFWFTGMDNTSSSWRTQIASFRFDLCGCILAPLPPVVEATVSTDNQIDLFWEDSELDTVVEYLVRRSRSPGGPYETIAVVPDDSPGFAGGPGYSFEDTDVSGYAIYYYVVTASDGDLCRSSATNEVSATGTGSCTLEPIFAGLVSATSGVVDTCSVDLAWGAAQEECDGPTAFNIYRSTAPGFTPGPATLLASGTTATSVRDVNALAFNTTLYYVVRAVDLSNGVEDDNLVEIEVSPSGAATGPQTLLAEDFENEATFADWTVTTGPGVHTCGEWARSDLSTRRPSGASGFFALADNECHPLLGRTSSTLYSPVIDVSMPNVAQVTLDLDMWFNHDGSEVAKIEVFDGANWVAVWEDGDLDVNGHKSFDVTSWAAGNPSFQIRFDYQNATQDKWFSVDNVVVEAFVLDPCTTSPTPASVPDGSAATAPLLAERMTVGGDVIDLSWDASSCAADGYNLLHGDLGAVSSVAVTGSVCTMGTAGTFTWNGVPAGSLFFLVVGTDGAATESSWGRSALGERHGLAASGQCSVTAKEISNICE